MAALNFWRGSGIISGGQICRACVVGERWCALGEAQYQKSAKAMSMTMAVALKLNAW